MSETPEFHPQIEKALVTSGDDIGRVKDIELAHDMADGENASRDSDFPLSEERMNELRSDNIKVVIARRAVNTLAQGYIHNVAVSGALGKPLPEDGYTQRLIAEAARVGDDYNRLQELSNSAAEARAHGTE